MKKIDAYIKKQRLNEVIEQLHMIEGLSGVSVHEIRGFGRSREENMPVHIVDNVIDAIPSVKLEIVCVDSLVDSVVGAVEKGGHTGLRGDGKIYISAVEDAVRISTGDRGEEAV